MVSLHLLYFKMHAAFYADAFLPLIGCPRHLRRESPYVQMLLLAVQKVFIDPLMV